jgi:aryl-alcohol dehydrogenase-like predicted oxidoreductase
MTTLGLGLIGIGRKWGVAESSVPTEVETQEFLQGAFELGIRYFDTAPAYGYSEERLGKWFQGLSSQQQAEITIATKCGEFWDFDTQAPYRSYTFEQLKQSIDLSFQRLGRIDILQLHGTTPQVLEDSEGIHKAFEYAQFLGVKKLGASISDFAAFPTVVNMREWEVIQFPHNELYPASSELISAALKHHKALVTNRPFGMGELAARDRNGKVAAYRFVLNDILDGIILTGTKSLSHLKENLELFAEAQRSLLGQ